MQAADDAVRMGEDLKFIPPVTDRVSKAEAQSEGWIEDSAPRAWVLRVVMNRPDKLNAVDGEMEGSGNKAERGEATMC
jgi:hypothetical protein